MPTIEFYSPQLTKIGEAHVPYSEADLGLVSIVKWKSDYFTFWCMKGANVAFMKTEVPILELGES